MNVLWLSELNLQCNVQSYSCIEHKHWMLPLKYCNTQTCRADGNLLNNESTYMFKNLSIAFFNDMKSLEQSGEMYRYSVSNRRLAVSDLDHIMKMNSSRRLPYWHVQLCPLVACTGLTSQINSSSYRTTRRTRRVVPLATGEWRHATLTSERCSIKTNQ